MLQQQVLKGRVEACAYKPYIMQECTEALPVTDVSTMPDVGDFTEFSLVLSEFGCLQLSNTCKMKAHDSTNVPHANINLDLCNGRWHYG